MSGKKNLSPASSSNDIRLSAPVCYGAALEFLILKSLIHV